MPNPNLEPELTLLGCARFTHPPKKQQRIVQEKNSVWRKNNNKKKTNIKN
jgi:hypothetical protein